MRENRKSDCGIWKILLLIFAGMILTGCSKREELFPKDMDLSVSEEENVSGELSVKEKEPLVTEPLKEENPTEVTEATEIPQKIFVDVCGAVVSPGVYEIPEGSRVFQAVEAAGGYLPKAAQDYLNKAKSLTDGQQIYIPTLDEVEEGLSDIQAKLPQVSDLSEAASDDADQEKEADGTAGSEGQMEERINLNTADAALLSTLSGIGASKAEAIIAYRQEHGGFASIEEIMNVEGIKEGTFSKIKDKISAG